MSHTVTIPTIELNNGLRIPQIGLGVWQAGAGQEVKRAVSTALEAGYRLFDTARNYGNEQSVGEAIRESGIPREEVIITTKLWNTDQGYTAGLKAFNGSLERLGMDYVDLYLIHWPLPSRGFFKESWRALERLYNEQTVRAIGVSNFKPRHLEELQESWDIVPMVNQIELHPHFQQIETRQYCEEHDIAVESYSPLKHGGDVLDDPVIIELADKYRKSPAQIILRWHVEEGFITIPKSVAPKRIRENIDIFDFSLHEDDIELIREMNREERISPDPDDMDRMS